MLEHALGYAALGWPVFPVHTPVDGERCSCGHAGCGKQTGKHPRTWHGLYDATTDATVITAWWEQWPDANIGARTGVAFDLFDVDATDYAEATEPLEQFEYAGPIARSGSGGWHFFVAPTGQGNRAKMGGLPLDWRGKNGYVILPPSLHRTGGRYSWLAAPQAHPVNPCPQVLAQLVASSGSTVSQRPQAVIPEWLPRFVPASTRRRRANLDSAAWSAAGLTGLVRDAAEGERNATLHWAACRVGEDERSGKCTSAQAADALEQLAKAAVDAGLSTVEVHGRDGHGGTLRSGYRNGLAGRGVSA